MLGFHCELSRRLCFCKSPRLDLSLKQLIELSRRPSANAVSRDQNPADRQDSPSRLWDDKPRAKCSKEAKSCVEKERFLAPVPSSDAEHVRTYRNICDVEDPGRGCSKPCSVRSVSLRWKLSHEAIPDRSRSSDGTH